MLMSLCEHFWDEFTPPSKGWGSAFLGKSALDETAVKVECGNFGGRFRVTADTMEA